MVKLDRENEMRQRNATYLDRELSRIPGIRPLARRKETTRHSYHIYVFRYDSRMLDGIPRKLFVEALNAEGIPVSGGYNVPIYRQPFMLAKRFGPFDGWKRTNPELDYGDTSCPVAEKAAAEEGCWLSQNVLLGTREDMQEIVSAVLKIYEGKNQLHSLKRKYCR